MSAFHPLRTIKTRVMVSRCSRQLPLSPPHFKVGSVVSLSARPTGVSTSATGSTSQYLFHGASSLRDGISHGDEDDGQWFGLPEPVNGEARTNELLQGKRVVGVELDEQTADLRIVFDDGVRLDFFNNSSGYEGWQAAVPAGRRRVYCYRAWWRQTDHPLESAFDPLRTLGDCGTLRE